MRGGGGGRLTEGGFGEKGPGGIIVLSTQPGCF